VTRFVVGLISDTHGLLRPGVAAAFSDVDLILHAGDVGAHAVLDALARIARVEAVYGNVDDPDDPAFTKERVVSLDGITIHVSHGNELGRPTPELVLAQYSADVVVFGHTHRAVVVRTAGGRLAVNPGSAGPRRFDLKPSVARLVIEGRQTQLDLVALG
jgi:uncharacterized protein